MGCSYAEELEQQVTATGPELRESSPVLHSVVFTVSIGALSCGKLHREDWFIAARRIVPKFVFKTSLTAAHSMPRSGFKKYIFTDIKLAENRFLLSFRPRRNSIQRSKLFW